MKIEEVDAHLVNTAGIRIRSAMGHLTVAGFTKHCTVGFRPNNIY